MQLVLQHCCETTNPVSDFWHSSSCSSKWGSNWPRVSSPTQHVTTLSVSCARVMIFTQDLSVLEKRLASWKRKSMHCLPSSLVDMCICKYYCERFVPRSLFISRWSMIVRVSAVLNSWFATTRQVAMLVVNTRNIFWRIYMKMVFISKKRETLFFLITNLLVKGEEIFEIIPETLTLPETGEKGRGKKRGTEGRQCTTCKQLFGNF